MQYRGNISQISACSTEIFLHVQRKHFFTIFLLHNHQKILKRCFLGSGGRPQTDDSGLLSLRGQTWLKGTDFVSNLVVIELILYLSNNIIFKAMKRGQGQFDLSFQGCLDGVTKILEENLYIVGVVAITIGMVQVSGLLSVANRVTGIGSSLFICQAVSFQCQAFMTSGKTFIV